MVCDKMQEYKSLVAEFINQGFVLDDPDKWCVTIECVQSLVIN